MGINTGKGNSPKTQMEEKMGQAMKDKNEASPQNTQHAFEQHQQAAAADPNYRAQQEQYQQGVGINGRKGRLTRDLNTTMRRPFGRHQHGEQLGEYIAVFQQLINGAHVSEAKNFDLQPLDNTTSGLPLSCLLVVYKEKNILSVFTLILEASYGNKTSQGNNILPEVPREIAPGFTTTVQLVAGDALGKELWETIAHNLESIYGNGYRIADAGAMTIPHEIVPNRENPHSLSRIWFTATQAAFSKLELITGDIEPPFTAEMIDTKNEQITANVNFADTTKGGQALTATGAPVRSDFRITLECTSKNQQFNHNNPLMMSATRAISSVDGYVDLAFEPAIMDQQVGWAAQQQQAAWGGQPQHNPMATVRYRPRIILTRADTEIDAITLELQLLSLASSTLLMFNDAWTQCFKPNPNAVEPDLKDIGAVGYEVNFDGDATKTRGEKIPTKTQEFLQNIDTNMMTLLPAIMHRNPLISMDIEETGELSWIQEVFLGVAAGAPDAIAALKIAASNLTCGYFNTLFDNSKTIVHDELVRIPLGYYNGPNGIRDLRDVDYLAVLNKAGATDLEQVTRFSSCFDDRSKPMEMRTQTMLDIIRKTVGSEHVRVTGYARRYSLSPDFLMAIMEGVKRAGLVFSTHTNTLNPGVDQPRGQYAHQHNPNMAFNPQMVNGYFVPQTYGNQQGGGFVNQAPSTSYDRGGYMPTNQGGYNGV